MKKVLTIDQINKIVELSNRDMYRTEIAREVGVSISTVYKYQQHFGLV